MFLPSTIGKKSKFCTLQSQNMLCDDRSHKNILAFDSQNLKTPSYLYPHCKQILKIEESSDGGLFLDACSFVYLFD